MMFVRSNLATRVVAGLIAMAGALALTPVNLSEAADLSPYAYKPAPNSPYNDRDPRYAELYGPDDHYDKHHRHKKIQRRRAETYYGDSYKKPVDKHDLYRDPQYERRYSYDRRDRHARPWRGRFALAPHCVPRRVVMRRLFRDGWHDFHGLELHGPKARVRAHSDDGRLFALTIARCSGEIVAARQIEYRHTHGRYDRRGYSEVPYRDRSYK